VPIVIGIAIFRYHLCDIELVISKTPVYGPWRRFITGVYIAIVVGLGSLAQQQAWPNLGLSLLATAIVAVAFQPVRQRVRHVANRLLRGKRATPYEVLSEFSERMAGTTSAKGPAAPHGPDPGRWHRRRQGGRVAEGRRRPPRRRQLATRGPAVPRVRATPAGPLALDGVDRILAVALQGEVLGALSCYGVADRRGPRP
jgi:hypothetical protein